MGIHYKGTSKTARGRGASLPSLSSVSLEPEEMAPLSHYQRQSVQEKDKATISPVNSAGFPEGFGYAGTTQLIHS